jgi:hypothetical protein
MGEFDVDDMIKKNRKSKIPVFGNKYANNNTFVGRSVCSYKPYEDCNNGGYIEGSKSKKKTHTKKYKHKNKSKNKKTDSQRNTKDNKINKNENLNFESKLKTSDFMKKSNDSKVETQISYNISEKTAHIHADSHNVNQCIGCEHINNCKLFEQGFGELCKKKTE